MTTPRFPLTAALAAVVLTLGACSGGSTGGTATTVHELAEDFAAPAAGGGDATLGRRGGFDTAATASEYEVTDGLPGATVTAGPAATSYGFRGEHGFAAVTLAAGALSAEIDGETFSGEFALAQAAPSSLRSDA